MTLTVLDLDRKTRDEIEQLVRMTGKPEKVVFREVVATGLKSYKSTPTKGVKALLDLTEWAEKNQVTGPSDLSTNHNKYAWEE